jgi:hypothetical protein
MARIAALLDPAHKEATEQLQLIDAIIEMQEIKSETFDPGLIDFDLPGIKLLDEEFTAAYVSKLIGFSIRTLHSGDSVTYGVITRYARYIGMQYLAINHEFTLVARQLWAESLAVNSLFDEAYEELNAILPIMKDVMAWDDRRLHEALLMEGQLLTLRGNLDGPIKTLAAMKFFDEFENSTHPFRDYDLTSTEVPKWLRDDIKATLKKAPNFFKNQDD